MLFPFTALLMTHLFVLSMTANSVIIPDMMVKLSIQRRLDVTSARDIVRHDKARARYLRTRGQALMGESTISKQHAGDNCNSTTIIASSTEFPTSMFEFTFTESSTSPTGSNTSSFSTKGASYLTPTDFDQPVVNRVVTYVATIGVGNPPTMYNLIVDTGSSNTWIGAMTPYNATDTSTETGQNVSVRYGSGSFSGKEFLDKVTLTDGLVITNQSIGVANRSAGFVGFDGILGLGPASLTKGTLSPSSNETILTVTDNAFRLGLIPNNQIGIYFESTNRTEVVNGELTWGGVDEKKFTGELNFVPVTSTSPARIFWGVDQGITYGDSTTILNSTAAGIVDTGTTLIYLANDAYKRYIQATGAMMDYQVGLLTIAPCQLGSLKSLFFNISGVTYELTANAQLWPRSLNTAIGGQASSIYLIVANLGTPSGSGFDFINGYAFLERFYTVYDTANKRIGFATTPFTNATSN